MPPRGDLGQTKYGGPSDKELWKIAARKAAGLPPVPRRKPTNERSTFRAGQNTVRFEFNGRDLVEKMRAAARVAVNETVDAARDDARATHTWKPDPRIRHFAKGSVDTDLEMQIVSKHARRASQKVGGPDPLGSFGYTKRKGFYGLFHEEGTVHERIHPALRPAAARVFPTLEYRIKRRLARGS